MGTVNKESVNDYRCNFSVPLPDRARVAQAATAPGNLRLGLMLGQQRCLLDLCEAEEILNAVSITPVPFTQDWYLGLANRRGDLINVIDLALFCGQTLSGQCQQSCVIVLPIALTSNCALLVSRVLGLHYLHQMSVQDRRDQAWPFGRRYLDRHRVQWTEISFAAIVADTRFLQMAL